MAGTSLTAESVNTIEWIRNATSLAVPVYQRDYRWTLESCRQLLEDIKAVALHGDPDVTHFIGSILTVGQADVTLVDGQQRLITLFLLLMAVRQAAQAEDPALAETTGDLLLAGRSSGLRLRAHESQASILRRLVAEGPDAVGDAEGGILKENYSVFSREVAYNWRDVCTGLRRLENGAIHLGDKANAQQVFESLNSTGESLVNHELMHNYVLMGLSYDEQVEIERDIWARIEAATGNSTERFWRDYLVLTSDRLPDLQGEHGLYRVFKERFPSLGYQRVRELGEQWVHHADWYHVLLHPETALDPQVKRHLGYLGDHFSGMSPLTLGLYRDLSKGLIDTAQFVDAAGLIQSMSLRRALVGLDRDLGLASTLCRALTSRHCDLIEGIVKRTPEDPQTRLALRLGLPLSAYVLQRLQEVDSLDDMQVEHIYPQTPTNEWTGDGIRTWGDMSESEQAELKMVLPTVGNLTLLEAKLNQGAGNRSFREKQTYYERSKRVPWASHTLAAADKWDKGEIEARTEQLSENVLRIWTRPAGVAASEEEDLVRVVDMPRQARRGLFNDQFEFARLGERQLGNVTGVKDLWLFIVGELWRTRRDELLAYAVTERSWPLIRDHHPPRERWATLDGGYFVFWGWAWQWLLAELQNLLQAFDLADKVRVKLRETDDAE